MDDNFQINNLYSYALKSVIPTISDAVIKDSLKSIDKSIEELNKMKQVLMCSRTDEFEGLIDELNSDTLDKFIHFLDKAIAASKSKKTETLNGLDLNISVFDPIIFKRNGEVSILFMNHEM
jgi:hypothetical protein